MSEEDKSKLVIKDEPKKEELIIPDEAKAMAQSIISEAIKLMPQAPVSSPTTTAMTPDIKRRFDIIDNNMNVIRFAVERILSELVDPAEMKKIGLDVDKKVKAKNERVVK